MSRAINELVSDEKFAGREFFFERANRADGDDAIHADKFEGIDVGAVIDFRRKNAMAAAVSREERNPSTFEKARDDGFRGIAEGRVDADFLGVRKAFHVVKAAAADDSYAGLRFFGRTVRLGLQKDSSLSWVSYRLACVVNSPDILACRKEPS
jgi:hypothetical protein